MDKPIPEAVRNPNIAVIEQARDTFPEGHYLRGALDHAAAEMAVLSNRLRRADATAAQQQGQAVACPYRTTCTCLGACAFGWPGNGAAAPPSAPVGVLDDALLDRLSGEVYQVHCDAPIRPFPNDTHWPKWRAVVQHVANTLAQQPAAVDGAMVERALVYRARHEDGASWPDAYSESEQAYERETMHLILTAALATQHQEPTT